MEVVVKDGQTLADVAVQEFGQLEAASEIARLNGLSIGDVPVAGSRLKLPEGTWNRVMATYCKAHEVSPATERDASGVKLRTFTSEFNETFA